MTGTERDGWTPGPWKASETSPGGDWCIHAAGTPWQLAYLAESSQIDWPLEANARLIAAAPDLVKAVDSLINLIDAYGHLRELSDCAVTTSVRAALARARGGGQ